MGVWAEVEEEEEDTKDDLSERAIPSTFSPYTREASIASEIRRYSWENYYWTSSRCRAKERGEIFLQVKVDAGDPAFSVNSTMTRLVSIA